MIFEETRQNDEYYYSRGLSSVKNSAGTQIGIKLEDSLSPVYARYKATDNLYIVFSSKEETFQISCDGIYWLNVKYPENLENDDVISDSVVSRYTELKDKILFKTNKNQLFEYNKDDLINVWQTTFGISPAYVKFDNTFFAFETAPVIENGTTLIPIRFLFEQMGAEVDWDSDTQTASISDDDTVISFSIDDTTAKVNGKSADMTVPAQLINDKTMLPVRFLSEELGYTVTWDGDNRIITIE